MKDRIDRLMTLAHYTDNEDLESEIEGLYESQDRVAIERIERCLQRRLNGKPLRTPDKDLEFEADFDEYDQRLKAARRNAREAYVHYRSLCDILDSLPAAVDADYEALDELCQASGDLDGLFASDFWV